MSKKIINIDDHLIKKSGEAIKNMKKMVEQAAAEGDHEALKKMLDIVGPLAEEIKKINEDT